MALSNKKYLEECRNRIKNRRSDIKHHLTVRSYNNDIPSDARCQRCGRNNHDEENCFAHTVFIGPEEEEDSFIETPCPQCGEERIVHEYHDEFTCRHCEWHGDREDLEAEEDSFIEIPCPQCGEEESIYMDEWHDEYACRHCEWHGDREDLEAKEAAEEEVEEEAEKEAEEKKAKRKDFNSPFSFLNTLVGDCDSEESLLVARANKKRKRQPACQQLLKIYRLRSLMDR